MKHPNEPAREIDPFTLADDDLVDEVHARVLLGGRSSPISIPTLYRGVRDGRFPPPIKVGSLNRWRPGELRQAIERMAAKRQGTW